MAYSESLAQRIRGVLTGHAPFIEKRMFGGLSFLYRGNMCCGVVGDTLMVRVGPDAYEESLALPHARPKDFTGKPRKGFVYVDPSALETKGDLAAWIGRGLTFVEKLPEK